MKTISCDGILAWSFVPSSNMRAFLETAGFGSKHECIISCQLVFETSLTLSVVLQVDRDPSQPDS